MLDVNPQAGSAENDNSTEAVRAVTISDYSQVGDVPPFMDKSGRAELEKWPSLYHRCVNELGKEKKETGRSENFWRDMRMAKDGTQYPDGTDRNISAFCKRFGVVARWDLFSGQYTLEGVPHHVVLNDYAVADIITTIRKMGCKVAKDDVRRLIEAEGRELRHNPLQEYIGSLRWDGTPKLETVLVRHFGAEDSAYTRETTRAFFVGAVRRLKHPGCQHDYVLVLVGPEGLRKSRFFMIMGYTVFYTGSLPVGADDKRVIETCGGKWIIELKEMSGLNKHEDTEILTFIDRPFDHGTLKWDKYACNVSRAFVFGASTNNFTPLKGVDGNRRWWLAHCKTLLDDHALLGERAQLWAEAVHLEKEGALNYLTPEVEKEAREIQREAVLKSPIYLRLEELLHGHVGVIFGSEIYAALGADNALKLKNAEQQQIEAAMKALGWDRGKPRISAHCNGGNKPPAVLQRRGFTKGLNTLKAGAPSVLRHAGRRLEVVHARDYISSEDMRQQAG